MRPSATLAHVIPMGLYTLLLAPLVSLSAAASTTAPNTDELIIDTTRPVPCTRKTHNGDTISVHYNGSLASDGTQFDSSQRSGVPFTFELGAGYVIKGWDLGLLDMCIGERRRLTIPARLGYGSGGSGPIPGGATLVFETELLGIQGVEKEEVQVAPANGGASKEKEKELADGDGHLSVAAPDLPSGSYLATATASPVPVSTSTPAAKPPATAIAASPMDDPDEERDNECHLLGSYALFVQGALGLLALTALVVKRWREHPRRPVKIWFFDVSKQVFGSALLHLANVLMSMLSSGSFDVATAGVGAAGGDEDQPNPCSFYLLNIFIDTTIGIPILVLLLRILHHLFLRTSLANPPESIRSGNYSPSSPSSPQGSQPRWTWWLKQSLIYFLGLFGMKLCVFFLFQLLPWIAWVGDWALRWTQGSEALQITFVMFVFPLVMNALQYWIIDGFIKDRGHGNEGDGGRGGGRDREGYGRVRGEEDGEAEGFEGELGEGDEEWLERHRRDRRGGRGMGEEGSADELEEANPTAVPIRRGSSRGDAQGTGKGRVQSRSREYDPGRDGES